jgi:hypothetical protein
MEPFNTLFEYLPSHRIGICKAHYHGVLLSQLSSHLQSGHKELTVATRKAIVLAATAFPDWATSAEEVVYPRPDTPTVAHLPVYKDGFMCQADTRGVCSFIVRTLQGIQKHCRDEHGWTNPRKRGRPYQSEEAGSASWREGVWCQKYQPSGQLGRLFQVSPLRSEGAQYAANEEGDLQRALKASFLQSTIALQKAQKDAHALVEVDSNRYLWNTWLRRTQWARHLAGFNRSWLLRQAQRPDDKEGALRRVCWAVEMVIWKA